MEEFKYLSDDSVRHALLIKATGGSLAQAFFYVKGPAGWTIRWKSDAFIGKNGLGKRQEGDGKTPTGDFSVSLAFGLAPDPGTRFDYLPVTEDMRACDVEGPYYNRIVKLSESGCEVEGEKMSMYTSEYYYGLVIDYNRDNIFPLGSHIFLHCKGDHPWTGGCVALDRDLVEDVLRTADSTLRIIIN